MINLISHILYILLMGTSLMNAIPTNCTVYSQRVNETVKSRGIAVISATHPFIL